MWNKKINSNRKNVAKWKKVFLWHFVIFFPVILRTFSPQWEVEGKAKNTFFFCPKNAGSHMVIFKPRGKTSSSFLEKYYTVIFSVLLCLFFFEFCFIFFSIHIYRLKRKKDKYKERKIYIKKILHTWKSSKLLSMTRCVAVFHWKTVRYCRRSYRGCK